MFRQATVVFHENLKCFWHVEQKFKFRGITALLKSLFYPSFKYPKVSPVPGKKRSGSYGMRRGTTVDRQLCKLARGETVQKMHPFATAAWSALMESGLRPVDGQVVVFDDTSKLATGIDILCFEANRDEPVLIEVKCSSVAATDTTTQRMRGCLSDWYSCLQNQYVLQAAMTRILFERTFQCRASAYVLHVGDTCTRLTRVPRLAVFDQAYNELVEHAATAPPVRRPKRKQKTAKKPKTGRVKKTIKRKVEKKH